MSGTLPDTSDGVADTPGTRRYVRWGLSVIVALLVVFAASRVDWHGASSTLMKASPLVVGAALIVNLSSLVLRGVRWWIFLRRVGAVPLSVAVRGAIVGSGLNNLLVANGGDAARTVLVARATRLPRTTVLATLALDRLFDPICFGLLLFVATFVIPLPGRLSKAQPVAGGALIVALGLLVLLIRAPADAPDAAVVTVGWRSTMRTLRQQVVFLSTSGRFIMAALASIGVWGLQIVVFSLAARSVGVSLPVAGSIAAILLTNTGLILRATPGNVGYFQFAYALATSPFGVPTSAAVAAAVLLQLVQIVPVTLIALALAPRLLDGDASDYIH
jgi:uncharacterized membrane protein YbhN (UPF0104 family)